MVKNRYAILTIIVSLLTILGLILIVTIKNDQEKFNENIVIEGSGVTTESLDVSLEGFYPGKSQDYTIKINCPTDGEYKFTLSFNEAADGLLKNYLDVCVFVGNEQVAQVTPLKDYLSGSVVEFTSELRAKEATIIKIQYTMPQSVGNEAKNTTANFSVQTIIENEGVFGEGK